MTINRDILNSNNHFGMTLVELLIYMGLLTIFILIFSTIISGTLDSFLRSQTTSSVAQDGRYIYTRFLYDVGRATGITTPLQLGDWGTTLQLTTPSGTIVYALSGDTLNLTDSNGTLTLHEQDTKITSLTFTRVGNSGGKHTVRLNFTISTRSQGAGANETKTFQTAGGLR